MYAYILVALGSALGGVARFWLSALVAQRLGENFPWGTIFINVIGSFLIGFVDTFTTVGSRFPLSLEGRQLLMIGVLGGYTTFSSFSLQTLHLARNGAWLSAAGNILLSVVLCLVAVWLGHICAQVLNRPS